MDNDKVLASCINMVYYIVTPSLKGKSRFVTDKPSDMHRTPIKPNRTLDLDTAVMALLEEMSKLSIALKAWRSPVSDALNDNRFFSSSSATGIKWRPIVRALVATDKSAFTEILGNPIFVFNRTMWMVTINYRENSDCPLHQHFQ